MSIIYSVIREQGVDFAIVQVKNHVIACQHQSADAISALRPMFGGIPVALMGTDYQGQVTYRGRQDIVRFLSHISPEQIPWKQGYLRT